MCKIFVKPGLKTICLFVITTLFEKCFPSSSAALTKSINSTQLSQENHQGIGDLEESTLVPGVSCFLDAIASPSTYLCQSVSEWISESLVVSDLEIAIASLSFASLFLRSVPGFHIFLALRVFFLPTPIPNTHTHPHLVGMKS